MMLPGGWLGSLIPARRARCSRIVETENVLAWGSVSCRLNFSSFKKKKKLFTFERDGGRGRGKKRRGETSKQAALYLTNCEIVSGAKIKTLNRLSHPGVPVV